MSVEDVLAMIGHTNDFNHGLRDANETPLTTVGGADVPTGSSTPHPSGPGQITSSGAYQFSSASSAIRAILGGVSARFTSPFGMRIHPVQGIRKMHNGIDLACPTGTPIYAAGAGKVIKASWRGAGGNCVYIAHPDGYTTRYMHMRQILVQVGDVIAAGQRIGLVGNTGVGTGPHLHYEVLKGETNVNPLGG